MMAKNLLDREKIESLEDIFEQIDVIDSAHIQSLANEMLNPNSLSYLIFEP
jgi:predicted Zn-dependent peptidase